VNKVKKNLFTESKKTSLSLLNDEVQYTSYTAFMKNTAPTGITCTFQEIS